jgi:hypothetical protein
MRGCRCPPCDHPNDRAKKYPIIFCHWVLFCAREADLASWRGVCAPRARCVCDAVLNYARGPQERDESWVRARNLFTLLVAYSQRGAAAAPVQLSETLLTQPCGRAGSFSHLCAPRDALELQGLITLWLLLCWCVVLASLFCTMRTYFCKKKIDKIGEHLRQEKYGLLA